VSTSCTSTAQMPSRARLCTGSGTRCAFGICCGGGATRRDHNYAGCEAAPHALSKPAQSSAGGGRACDKGVGTPARSWPHRRSTLGGRVARRAARLLNRGRVADGEDAAVAADDAQELVRHDGAEMRLPRQLALPARARPYVAAAAPRGLCTPATHPAEWRAMHKSPDGVTWALLGSTGWRHTGGHPQDDPERISTRRVTAAR